MRLPITRKEMDMSLINFIDMSSRYADLSDSVDELIGEWVGRIELGRERERETDSRRGWSRKTLDDRVNVAVEARERHSDSSKRRIGRREDWGVTCSESRTFSWRRCCSMLLGLAILSAMEGGEGAMLTAEPAEGAEEKMGIPLERMLQYSYQLINIK
jgi:hypothetical protein